MIAPPAIGAGKRRARTHARYSALETPVNLIYEARP